MKPMPKAYSYLRFSTPEQQKGDSRRRQNDAARAYAKQNDLDLDAKFTFQDLGVSAFRGRNREKGALGLFLAAVKNGRIPRGSYLLVEDFDRLSRDQLDNAYDLFRSILKLGINIATLDDEKLYTPASLNILSDMIRASTRMDLAHAESLKKSHRLSGSWKTKRDKAQTEGRKLTARCPAWLTLDRERNAFVIDRVRAKVIRRIFDMTIAGHGKSVIARRFNTDAVPTFGDSQGWHPSYVQKILEGEAVCGVFQPMRMKNGERVADGDAIANYFPAVVDRATFERARRSRAARRIPAGRKGETFSNLFTGLAFCGNCGATLHFVNKGSGSKGGAYLVCSNARRAVSNCKAPSWRYDAVETLLIRRLRKLNFDELFPAITSSVRAKIQELEDSKLETESALAQTQQRVKNIIKEIEGGSKSRTLAARLEDLEATSDKLSATLTSFENQLEEERDRARSSQHDFHQTKDSFARLDRAHATRSPELYDLRSRLHQLLKRLISRIEMSPLPLPPRGPHDPMGDLIGMIVVSFQSAELTQAFLVTRGMKEAIHLPMQHRNGKVSKADIELLLNPRIVRPPAAQ